VFEVNTLLDKSNLGEHGGDLFFAMMKKMYRSIDHELEFIRHDIAVIEEHIFAGHEIRMVSAISRSARDLLNLRQVIEPHREILHEFETGGGRLFGEGFVPRLRALSDEYYRVHNHVMRQTESLHELRETNNALLTTKQNETMKTFTIMAFLTFPLSLIASIFSTDAQHEPIVGSPYDFWIIIGLMLGVAFLMYLYFKRKHWL